MTTRDFMFGAYVSAGMDSWVALGLTCAQPRSLWSTRRAKTYDGHALSDKVGTVTPLGRL